MAETQPIIAAVGAVIFRGQEILLIQRAKSPYKAHWSIPGGKIDYGEGVKAALKREIMEETNVDIEILGLIDIFEALPDHDGDPHYLLVDYACRYLGGEVMAGDDAMDAGFFSIPEALSRVAWDKTRQAIGRALPYAKEARVL